MKKRIFSLLLVIAMLMTALPVNVFAACSHSNVYSWSKVYGENRHSGYCYSCWTTVYGDCDTNGWASDYSGHYQACSVCEGKASNTATPHTWSYAVGSYGAGYHKQYCSVCDYVYTSNSSCDYYGQPYITENGQHWQECADCGLAGKKTNCSSWNDPTPNADGVTHSITCSTCKVGSNAPCTFGSYTYDYYAGSQGHYKTCTECGNKTALSAHTNKTYTPGYYNGEHTIKCKDCGYSMGTGECQYGSYTKTATQHSHTCTLCKDTVTENHSYNSQNKCVCGAEKHDHKWEVSASGNTITVACTGATGTCEYNKQGGKLTITASDAAYDGTAKAATVTNNIETGSYYDDSYTVTYYEKMENGKYGSWGSSSAPTEVGEYKAEVYSALDSSKKASVTFKITTGTLTATATGYEGAYDGQAHGITVNAPSTADITYSQTPDGNYSWWAPTFTEVGEYTVYYKVTEDSGNYAPTEVSGSATVKITVADLADLLTVTAEDTEFTFNRSEWTDGVPHSIKLDVKEYQVPGTFDNITVEYSEDGGTTWTSSNPTYRDAGVYTVNYRIYVKGDYDYSAGGYTFSDNYIAIEGSNTVTIKKADLPIIDLAGYHGPYDGNTHYGFAYKYASSYGDYFTLYWYDYLHSELDYDFSWTDENGTPRTLNVEAGDQPELTDFPGFTKQNVAEVDYDDDSGAGVHAVTVTIGSDNYNEKTFTYYVQIGPGGAYAEDTTYTYDGVEHYIANYIAGRSYFFGEIYNFGSIKIEYREKGSDTWLPASQEPGQTEVGYKDVEWRVTMDSDQNGEFGEESNSFGSSEVFTGTNRVTVTPVPLTVTAKDKTITYGDAPSADGVEITGFVNGEDASVLEGEISYTFTYEQYDDVGEYEIIPSGLSSNNYDITYVPGKLTVVQKELGIDWGETEFVYDGEEHVPAATATGTVNGDEIILTVEGAETEVGEYTATVTGMTGEKAHNYKLPEDGLTTPFKIVKKPVLTVTAKDKTIIYGDAPSHNGVEITGYAEGDDETVLKGEATYTYNYEQFDDVGEYAITPAGLYADGYDPTQFVDGKLTVEQKMLGIEWDYTKLVYTGEAQIPTATATGTVNGDVITLIVEGEQTEIGEYTATVTGMTGEKAHNYILPEDGLTVTFEITEKPVLTVTALDKTITYGDEPANSGVEIIGFVEGDDEEILIGEITYTYDYEQYGDVGEYKITPAGLSADGYDVEFVDGKLTVEQKELGIIWGETEFVYDGEEHVPTATAVTVNGDEITLIVEGAQTEVGVYTATVTGHTGEKAGNYKLPEDVTVIFKIVSKQPVPDLPKVPDTGDKGFFLPLMLFVLSGIAGVVLIVFKKKFKF